MEHLAEFISNHLLLVGAFSAVLVLTLLNEWQHNFAGAGSLEPAKAILAINRNNAMVLDIRAKDLFDKGHIINSKQTPSEVTKLQNYKKHNHFIIVCENGSRSAQLATSMKKDGFENVSVLKGGIQAWTDDNLPLEATSKKSKKQK